MKIENRTGNISNANTALFAYTAGALTGLPLDLTGHAFEIIRVKQDETGYELIMPANVAPMPDGDYVISLGNTNQYLVSGDAATHDVQFIGGVLPKGANIAVACVGAPRTFSAGAGVTLIVPTGFIAAARDVGSVVQAKYNDTNTVELFGDLAAA